MKSFKGNVLSWDVSDGVIELALHRPPANEMGAVTLAELEHFAAAPLAGWSNRILGPTRRPLCSSSVASVVSCTDAHPRRPAERRRISRCTVYRFPRRSRGRHRIFFEPCSLTVSTCPPAPIEKFRRAAPPIAPRLCSGLQQRPPHGGNLMEDGMGVPGGVVETDFGVPPDIGSAHPASRALYCVSPAPTAGTPPQFSLHGVPIPTPLAGLRSHLASTAASSPSAPDRPRRLKNSAAPLHASHVGSALVTTSSHPTEEI